MMRANLALIGSALLLGACGGELNLACDDIQPYQEVVPHKRIEAPEGLDNLDPLNEVPVPEASPRPGRPVGSPCIDLPPGATSMQDGDDDDDEDAEESGSDDEEGADDEEASDE